MDINTRDLIRISAFTVVSLAADALAALIRRGSKPFCAPPPELPSTLENDWEGV